MPLQVSPTLLDITRDSPDKVSQNINCKGANNFETSILQKIEIAPINKMLCLKTKQI